MKKYMLLLLILLVPFHVDAKVKTTTTTVTTESVIKEKVVVENCRDLNQIWVKKNNSTIRVGLLAYDSGDTSINSEIQDYVCNLLKTSDNIEIEYEKNNKVEDKYHREMVWIYVNDKLLQEDLMSKGYGMVNYVTDDFSYIDNLCLAEANAIKDKKGIWTLGVEEKYCDSGIILEKIEKQNREESIRKELDKESIIRICIIGLSIVLLLLTIFVKVRNE